MPKSEDGEFELVLGNRQLLSGFFIIVILFGIFFTMGYFVGRSSSPSAVAPAAKGDSSAGASASPLPPGQAEVVTEPKAADHAAPGSTQPATDSGAPAKPEEPAEEPPPPKPAESKPAAPAPKPVESKKEESKKESAKGRSSEESGDASVARPKKGEMYLQVSAPLPAAAKGVVDALRRQGIQAIVAPGPPGKDTVRVLVGPFGDAGSAGKMRARLAEVGFKDTFAQKY